MTTTATPMSVMDAINHRASVRAFSAEAVSGEDISLLLRAAVRAPTAMHGEPWEFVVVQDRRLLRKIDEAAKTGILARGLAAHMLDASFDVFHGAGTLIVIGSRKPGALVEGDCWLAAENLMLAATAIGLGTCCIGSAVTALNDPVVKAAVGIPADVRMIVPIIVGHPAGEPAPSARRDPQIAAWL